MENLDHLDNFLRNPVVPQDLPERVAIYGIKGLLEVDEDHVEAGVPLQCLLHDDPQGCYLIATGSLLVKPCLFIPESAVKCILHPLQDYPAEHLAGNSQEHDAPPVGTEAQVTLLRKLNQETQLPVLRNVLHGPDLVQIFPVEVGASRDLTVSTSLEMPHRGAGVNSG